ncbi:MAG: hypothetical protein WBB28_16760 [Crinalium sp.]
MLKIRKNYLLDENQQPIAVQIPIADFEKIEKVLANSWWAQSLEESEEPLLSVAGILSGKPITSEEIEQELYGDE